MKRLAIVAMCFCAQQCLAQNAPPADIKTLKVKYEQGLAAIQEDANKALTNSVQGYVDALRVLGQKLQGAGDLDGMLAAKKESERFEKEKAIPESAVVADCAALRELQLKWQRMPDAMDISKSKRIVTLSRNHIAALEELKKQLTMQGKVEAAIEAKNEIEKVRTSAEVTAAEFVLTSADVNLTAKTNAVPRVVAPSPSGAGAKMPLVNLAREATVEVNRSSPGNGSPDKVHDGVTDDVAQPYTSYWFAGATPPQPDWVRLQFEKPAEVRSIRVLLPIGIIRFDAGHSPLDYEVVGLNRGQKSILASVKNGKHPRTESGPMKGVKWIVVDLRPSKVLDGVQLTCRRTSGGNYGPVVFEIQVMGQYISESN